MTAPLSIGGAALAALALAAGSGDASPRLHRTHLPPPGGAPGPTLPQALAVDETEYHLSPSHTTVAAGVVAFNAYNRGMDAHDLTITDAAGTTHSVAVPVSGSGALRVTLPPGIYKVYCSLFSGTPQSHDDLGMHFELTVR